MKRKRKKNKEGEREGSGGEEGSGGWREPAVAVAGDLHLARSPSHSHPRPSIPAPPIAPMKLEDAEKLASRLFCYVGAPADWRAPIYPGLTLARQQLVGRTNVETSIFC